MWTGRRLLGAMVPQQTPAGLSLGLSRFQLRQPCLFLSSHTLHMSAMSMTGM